MASGTRRRSYFWVECRCRFLELEPNKRSNESSGMDEGVRRRLKRLCGANHSSRRCVVIRRPATPKCAEMSGGRANGTVDETFFGQSRMPENKAFSTERQGFEPWNGVNRYSISSAAPSTARPPLRQAGGTLSRPRRPDNRPVTTPALPAAPGTRRGGRSPCSSRPPRAG